MPLEALEYPRQLADMGGGGQPRDKNHLGKGRIRRKKRAIAGSLQQGGRLFISGWRGEVVLKHHSWNDSFDVTGRSTAPLNVGRYARRGGTQAEEEGRQRFFRKRPHPPLEKVSDSGGTLRLSKRGGINSDKLCSSNRTGGKLVERFAPSARASGKWGGRGRGREKRHMRGDEAFFARTGWNCE